MLGIGIIDDRQRDIDVTRQERICSALLDTARPPTTANRRTRDSIERNLTQ